MNRNDENSWKTMIIIAFALVSVAVITFATVKSCAKQEGKSGSEVLPVAVETVSPSVSDGFQPPSTAPSSEGAEDVEAEFREQIAAQVDHAPARKYIGRCRLTVYNSTESSWGYATATGAKSQHLMTCAVDPKVIPYGSNVIVVDKDGEEWRFKAVDCGNFKGKWIDIFFDGSELGGIYWLDEVFGGDHADVYVEAAG